MGIARAGCILYLTSESSFVSGGVNGPRFYLNNGTGVFSVASDRIPADIANKNGINVYTSSALVDLDNDNDLDLFLGADEKGAGYAVLLNDGTGRFTLKTNAVNTKKPAADWITLALLIMDVDGDGDPDVICSNTPGAPFYAGASLDLLLNDGHASFSNAAERIQGTFSTSGWIKWLTAVDFNNDGIKDILASSNGGINSSILLGYGNGRYKRVDMTLPPSSGPLCADDFDKDGDYDLVSVSGSKAYVGENVKPFENSKAIIDVYGVTKVCSDAEVNVQLHAQERSGNTYQWLKNGAAISPATTSSYTATAAGSYTVVVRHGNYPADTSLVAEVMIVNAPVAVITMDGYQLTATEGTGYKWFRNGVALNMTTRTITISETGDYTVEVTGEAGCKTLSDPRHAIVTGIEKIAFGDRIHIYPTPAASVVYIDLPEDVGESSIRLLDLLGREVRKDIAHTNRLELNVENLRRSVYVIEVKTSAGTTVKKIFKL